MTGNKRILILEDEPLLAMDLEDLLVTNGYAIVGPFSAATDALASVDQTKPHAALLDVYVFQGLSFEVGRELKRRGVPFAFMTGLVAQDLLPADLAGAPVILKPYNEKELRSFLSNSVDEGEPADNELRRG